MDRPAGEHRSQPVVVDTAVGRLVATRIGARAGGQRLEVRTVLDLPADPRMAAMAAHRFVLGLVQLLRRSVTSGGER
jgi:hypothetical protein